MIGHNIAEFEDLKRAVYKLVCVLSWKSVKGLFINSCVCAELEVLKRADYILVWCSRRSIIPL